MKKIKALWGNARDTIMDPLTDFMVERPNIAFTVLIVIVVAFLASMGLDAPITLNE